LIAISYIGFNYKTIIEPKEESSENYYDFFVQKLRFEQEKNQMKRYSINSEFKTDFVEYFQLFDCLRVEKGWEINCYYYLDTFAGRPVFYTKKVDGNADSLQSLFANDGIFKYVDSIKIMDHIEVLDSEKGYFQLLLFDLIGEDFGKYWHSNYGHSDIICSKRMLKQISNRSDDLHDFDRKMKNKIKTLDYTLVYKDFGNSVIFRLVIFNAWDGFREYIYSINKQFPHKITVVKDRLLLKYHCGVLY